MKNNFKIVEKLQKTRKYTKKSIVKKLEKVINLSKIDKNRAAKYDEKQTVHVRNRYCSRKNGMIQPWKRKGRKKK